MLGLVADTERKPGSEVMLYVEFYRTYNYMVQGLYWFLIILYFDITLFSIARRVHKNLPFLTSYTHSSYIINKQPDLLSPFEA